MFSGGVGEYVYGRENRDFGDMGRRLGQAIRRRIDAGALPWPLLPAGECIRATALGASEYSVQLSGNTSYISKPGELLPRRNLQVLQPPYRLRAGDRAGRAGAGDPRAFHRLRSGRGRRRGGAGIAMAGRAVLCAHLGVRRRHPPRPRRHHRAQEAALHHARRRHRPDIGGDPARGAAGRERDPGDRRGGAARLRLHRSRPHPHAVLHGAGDDQVAVVQRGPAPRPPAPAHPSS